MRKGAPILVGLGAFLLVAGLVALLWAPGVVKRTPLDVDSTTRLTGEAARIDAATGELGEPEAVKALSVTQSDSEASSDDLVVFTTRQCLTLDEPGAPDCPDPREDDRAVNVSTDVFGTDRVTAEAVNDAEGIPPGAEPHEGLVNKWPFDAEQRTYPYWDGLVGEAVDAEFDRTETVDGLEVYVYRVSISDAPIEVAANVEGTYDDEKEIWVDPATGSIIHQIDDQQRYLADGSQALDLQLEFTPEQVEANVASAQDSGRSLSLITFWVPVVGIVGGLIALAAGLALLVRAGSSQGRDRQRA